VNTCTSEERPALFSLLPFPDSGRQCFYFYKLTKSRRFSTRGLRAAVFTQAAPRADLRPRYQSALRAVSVCRALPRLGSGHHHVNLAAPAPRADQPPVPVENGGVDAVALSHAGRRQTANRRSSRRWVAAERLPTGEMLQSLAEPDAVVIGASTRRLVGDLFEYRDLGAVEVKGIAAPVPAWQVLRPSAVESRFEALRAGADTACRPRRGDQPAIEALGAGQVGRRPGRADLG
jgi:hypothetical protein